MAEVLGSWSGMRKYLEQEMMADSLKGRIRYGCTSYKGMDGLCVFEICIDGKQFKRFSWETVNSYFIENGYKESRKPSDLREYWEGFHLLLGKNPVNDRTEYTDGEFAQALKEYRNQDIQKSVRSENHLVRMFAILDRRVGKRTLIKMKEEIGLQPEWLQQLYILRTDAEMI